MKTAVIGLGPHGRRIVQVINDMDKLDLVAVADPRDEALQDAKLPDKTARYNSAEQVWQDQTVELVCIATNGPSHAPLALSAMKAGITRILVEKPMATSLEDCDSMIKQAELHGVRLSVDQSRRHAGFYQWLRGLIRSGELGMPRAMWIQRPGIGLGCLATHSFDLAEFLFDAEAKRIVAWVNEPLGTNPRGANFVDPGGTVIMDFGPNLRAVVEQIEDGAGPMAVEIDLTAGRVRIDETSGEAEIIKRDLSVKPGPGRPPLYERLSLPPEMDAKVNMFTMLRGVIEELAGDAPMECDAKWGRRAVEILVAAHVSQKKGNLPVDVPISSSGDRSLCLPVT